MNYRDKTWEIHQYSYLILNFYSTRRLSCSAVSKAYRLSATATNLHVVLTLPKFGWLPHNEDVFSEDNIALKHSAALLPSTYFYRPPMELRGGTDFIRVCPSVILSTVEGSPCDHCPDALHLTVQGPRPCPLRHQTWNPPWPRPWNPC